jgi:ribonuclease P protein component
VRRNLLRRQVVSLGRDLGIVLQDSALVVRLKRGFDDKVFVSASSVPLKKAVRAELSDLFHRGLGRLRQKGPSA